MTLRDVFRSDVRRAINATPARRAVSFGSTLVLIALAVALGPVTPWWVWPILVVLEGIAFLVLGNRWATQDALAKDFDE